MRSSILAITAGDAGGIGPEVAMRAAFRSRLPAGLKLVIVGTRSVTDSVSKQLKLPSPADWTPAAGIPRNRVSLWEPIKTGKLTAGSGRITVASSRAAAGWIESAVEQCMAGCFDGIVTAPISKEGFARAGVKFPGHTEYIASLSGTKEFAMMLTGDSLRVTLVTRHVPLSQVPRLVTRKAIVTAGRMTGLGLKWMGAKNRKIAVCGLNPHSGDGGALGDDEARKIVPAISDLRKLGFNAVGPVPADTAFYQAKNGMYGAVIAMYHDQGLGPLKTLAFDSGINITLGLPFVRTSPDHGTAFDIAGKGRADATSIKNAIVQAAKLAARKSPFAP